MAKLILTDVASGYASTTAVNANNALVEVALENTLSRDGTGPNQMEADLDMNSNRILNLPAPASSNEPARLIDVQESAVTGLPAQTGEATKFLQTDGTVASWQVPDSSEVSFTSNGTGAVERTVQAKLRDFINVKDFGAVCDGVTDDTAAVQACCEYVAANFGNVRINGNCKFDPTFLSTITLSVPLTIEVNGTLTPTTTIPISKAINIIGTGGASGPQFSNAPMCAITPVSGAPTIEVTGAGVTRRLEGIAIVNTDNVGVYINGTTPVTANAYLERVHVSAASSAGAIPIVVDNAFWIWFRDCTFSAATESSMVFKATAASSYCGVVRGDQIRLAGKGMLFGADAGTQEMINFRFYDVTLENATSPLASFDATAVEVFRDFTFDTCTIADNVSAGSLISVIGGYRRQLIGLKLIDCTPVIPLLDAHVPGVFVNTTRDYANAGSYSLGYADGAIFDGFVQTNGLSRVSPSLVPYTSLNVNQDVTTWSGLTGTATVTTGKVAPDGTATAAELTSASGTLYRRVYDATPAVVTGDWIIGGVWAYSTNGSIPALISLPSPGTFVESGNSLLTMQNGLTYRTDSGWQHVVAIGKVDTGSAGIRMEVRVAAGLPVTYWKPWLIHIPATAGYSEAEVRRIFREIQSAVSLQTPGCFQLHTHQTLVTGKGATASRPTGVVAGAMWYDTTLGKPIWYNGSNWCDAAGTVV